MKELFWDDYTIAEAQEEGSNLIALGDVFLCQTDLILEDVKGLPWDINCQIEYGVWVHDYDDLAFDNCCISLLDFLTEHGAIILCSYPFEFIVSEECASECETAILACEQSLESAGLILHRRPSEFPRY